MASADMGVKIRFKKGAWWLVIDHLGRRRSKKIGDRDTAIAMAKKVREALAAGDLRCTVPDTAQTLVEGYATEWLAGLTGNLKASTVRFYSDNLRRYILPSVGKRAVADLARRDCRVFVAETRAKGLKLNTVKGIVRTLSALLSQAVEDEQLAANPALRLGKYLRRGDEEAREIQPLDATQAALLVTTAERHFGRWYPWVLCALRTGMRLGELIALQWGDIDWHERFIVVQRNIVRGTVTTPKSHQRRRVDMTPQLMDALLAWRRVQRNRWMKKGEPMPLWVFPSLTGTPVEERNLRHVFKRLLEKAGMRHMRIHDLRHTYASLLLQAGAAITYVSAQLGHRDASITLRVYAHYLPSGSQRDVDRLDAPHPSATPAQPAAVIADPRKRPNFFGMSGEPPRNRTENPQIKSLLLCQLS
jgi:integrase